MKLHRLSLQRPFWLLALPLIIVPIAEAASNRKPIANAGIDQTVAFSNVVALDGRKSKDPDGSIKKYLWSQIQGSKVALAGALTATPTFKAPVKLINQKPLALVFKLTVTDNQNAIANDTVVINVVTGKLNDTGITACGNKTTNGLPCPVIGYLGQDAESGRDKTHSDGKDGYAGFSFTKINSAGKSLPATAEGWACVKDNITGLIWESKTDDNRLHDVDWSYTWYDPDNRKNGSNAGTQNGGDCNGTSTCDTDGYVKAVNAAGWCGARDWRLPNREELRSIVDYHRAKPAIDIAYFPDTWSKEYWSLSPHASDSNNAWFVNFSNGGSHYSFNKYYSYQVRLVRGGQ